MKEKKISVKDIEIHELAKLTPMMKEEEYYALLKSIEELGQLEPAKIYHGKIVDGRHRLKALQEIGISTIRVIELNPKIPYEEMRDMIVNGFERRRHQTPTQLAIGSMKEYLRLKQIGNKVSQGEIASDFGISRVLLSLALKLKQLAGDEIIEILFNGNKVNISLDKNKPYYTDSLKSITSFYKKLNQQIAETSEELKIRKLLTDEEMFIAEEKFNELNNILNPDQLHYITNMLVKNGYGKFEEI